MIKFYTSRSCRTSDGLIDDGFDKKHNVSNFIDSYT